MRKIYVLDENGHLQEIDAGATSYNELQDVPLYRNTLNTTVTEVDGKIVVTPSQEPHRWSLEELNLFCGIKDGVFDDNLAPEDGRYDIITEEEGHEILLIDTVEVAGNTVRRVRRITSQYDWIYSTTGKTWTNISNDKAGSLIFSWKKPDENITYGTPVELEYNYYSATGKIGTIQLYVNDTLKATVSRNSSTAAYKMDITNYLSIGNNNVLLTVKSGENSEELFANINVVNLTFTSTFDENKLYVGKEFRFIYSVVGSVEKTVFIQLDDNEPVTKTFNESTNALGENLIISTDGLVHGIHEIKAWAEATVGANHITTPTLNYNFPVWKDDNGGTIIALNSAPTSVSEGETITISYTPYNNIVTSVPILNIYPEEYDKEPNELSALVGERRNWKFVATGMGDFHFTIKSENSELIVPITITKGAQIDYETSGLLYSLEMIGRDNASSKRDIIDYQTIDINQDEVYETSARMVDFNYRTDGWLTDSEEGGRNILRVNSTSQVIYPKMNLFTLLDDNNYSGCSFEVDFKGRYTSSTNRTLITLLAGKEGISINEQSVFVTLGGSTYKVDYKAEERIRVSITISKNVKNSDSNLIKIYINGVLSFVNTYSSSSFAGYNSDLIINPEMGFVDVYGLRLYNSELTMGQVLKNFIASHNSLAEKTTQNEWNNIYDTDGVTVSYTAVKALMPTFVFTTNDVNELQNLPPKKGEKRYGPVDYIDAVYLKDFSENYNADKEKPVADVQGTSSQKYPRKNFKIKTNNKHAINDNVVGEKVFTFKKDFMDSSHANNTGLAKLVQTLYFTPVPPQVSYIQWMGDGIDEETGEPTIVSNTAYDMEGRRIDFEYIFEYAKSIGDPFASLGAVKIDINYVNQPEDGVNHYYFVYKKASGATEYKMCEIDTQGQELKGIKIKDKSYVRTTVYGQPCAFFWHPTSGDLAGQYIYQGIYNFNTDKVATNNMELEEEGCLSFEFANNVTDGVLFKSCKNFTEIRNSFEYRAYEKDGISLGLWEDYYAKDKKADSGLVSWANGGQDEDDGEIIEIPILNALYGTDSNGDEHQLFASFNDIIQPINYPVITANVEKFNKEDPRTLEIEYRLQDGNIEASFVASTAESDSIKIKDTIKDLGGDAYHERRGTTPAPSGLSEGQALGVQIINSGVDYVIQWGYETNGSVSDWTDYCYVDDLLTTIPKELQGKVGPADVKVALKSGTLDDLRWSYRYPVEKTWELIAEANNIYSDANGTPTTPLTLRKYDLYEHMHQPIMDVVNWVIDCWNDYQRTNNTNKFMQEFGQHLNKEYVIIYYVMGLFAGAADSFAKNMFWNSYDGGQIWYPVYYDIDTCFGLSNDGHPDFPYSMEIYGEGSNWGTADIYNGAASNFWKLVYASFEGEIQEQYNKLRAQKLTFESVMEVLYKQQIALIAPAHYNEDAKFSYLPYPAYYYTAQGSRYERLKYWVEKRFSYLDSKLEYTDYVEDSYELRANATLPLEITADMDLYVGVKYGQDAKKISKKRCLAGQTVVFDPRDYGITSLNNLEVLIYGASHISSLGNLAPHQITSIKPPTQSKTVLESIVIGSEEPGYRNTNLATLSVGSNSMLKVLNVSNCVGLGSQSDKQLNLSQCPSIQTVLAKNTALNKVIIPDGSPIRQLHLPTIAELRLVNQILLTDLTVDSYNDLQQIVWDNNPKSHLKVETILNGCYRAPDNNTLNTVRIIGFNSEKAFDNAWMEWFMGRQGLNDTDQVVKAPYITGTLRVQVPGKEDLGIYVSQFNKANKSDFAYISIYDSEEEKYHYYSYDDIRNIYTELTEKQLTSYKLNIMLEQLVASENIFGISGEGEL